MKTLQESYNQAHNICRETKSMLAMQVTYFNDPNEINKNKLKAQTSKVKGLLNDYFPKPQSLR